MTGKGQMSMSQIGSPMGGPTQKQWMRRRMRRRMRKPEELSIRKTVAAVGRLNNSLPAFPKGKESDKFTPGEILEILEWSIPEIWRAKFDLDGYVPTEFTTSISATLSL
jgi:hypothetical protein